MRLRFILLISVVIIVSNIGVVLISNQYFRRERLRLLDGQIRESALVLVDSDFGDLKRINFAKAEELISEELGPRRIGKFFIVRNDKDEVVFSTPTTGSLPVKVPRTPGWVSILQGDHFVRALNLELPKQPDRTLQVGVVLDPQFLEWSILSSRFSIYLLILVSALESIAVLLAIVLLRPVQTLSTFLQQARENVDDDQILSKAPESLKKWMMKKRPDLFSSLVREIFRFVDDLQRRHRQTKLWSFQLAHEMKTPLTIAQARLEAIERKEGSNEDLKGIKIELMKTSETVQSFLNWAEADNALKPTQIFANDLVGLVEVTAERMRQATGRLISVTSLMSVKIFSDQLHLEQLIENLLSNAVNYSPPEKSVSVVIGMNEMRVTDQGPGIPTGVLERLGQPFNRNKSSEKGHGLGLAWVSSICHLYGWHLDIQTAQTGTTVTIHFVKVQENSAGESR